MREELIRVENGCFRREDEFYRFEISISRGECIGVYVDDHFTSGTAYLDLFKGGTHLERGRAFSCARRVGPLRIEQLPKLGVVMKRAQYFLTASGRLPDGLRFTQDSLLRSLISLEQSRLPEAAPEQLSLFDNAVS